MPRMLEKCSSDDEEVILSSILQAYSALAPTKSITIPETLSFTKVHGFLLDKILLNRHLRDYPPSEQYQHKFWKWALGTLEYMSKDDEHSEIDERVYEHYVSLIQSVRSGAPSDSYITYYWKPGKPQESKAGEIETITLLESRTTIEAGTTGLRTWRASVVLAQYLLEHPEYVSHKTVLELGSGTGLIGILVASMQLRAHSFHSTTNAMQHERRRVFLTDVNSSVLARCRHNIHLSCNRSSLHPGIEYWSLDWFDSLTCRESLSSLFCEANADIILGADIVFDPELVPPLVATLHVAISHGSIRMALIALTVRNEETLSYFLHEIQKVLRIEEVKLTITDGFTSLAPDEVDAGLEVRLFRLTRI
ncbi:putative methyltransferase-domain-containing protein [Phlebopus sp. FC_14]|nr:putative methyltransferase-domain-containing protein [Phlebopus sp. FC_14]